MVIRSAYPANQSQTVDMRRTLVLLCWTFSLECSSRLFKKDSTLSLPTFRRQLKHFCFSHC